MSAGAIIIRLPSAHSHLPTIVGAAFAVSGLRALTMLAPFGTGRNAPLPMLLVLIAVFARRDPDVDVALRRGLRAAHVRDAMQRLGRAAGAS